MNTLAHKLTAYIIKKEIIDSKYYDVYAYGFLQLLEIGIAFLLYMLVAGVFGMLLEGIIFMLVFIPLRGYAGGMHFDRYFSCVLTSVLTYTAVLYISKITIFSTLVLLISILSNVIAIKKMQNLEEQERHFEEQEIIKFAGRLDLNLFLICIAAVILYWIGNNHYLMLIDCTMILMTSVLVADRLSKWIRMKIGD